MTRFSRYSKNKYSRITPACAGFFLLLTSIAWPGNIVFAAGPAQNSDAFAVDVSQLPLIANLQKGDPLFDQLSADLTGYYKARANKTSLPVMTLMRYRVKTGETLFSVSARLNLPHSTLSTINHIGNPAMLSAGDEIVVPNLPGVYLTSEPVSQLEQLLSSRLGAISPQMQSVRFTKTKKTETFSFFPSEDFSPQERLAFLGSIFRAPLDSYRISSAFGPRRNPITGALIKHEGIDLVAPYGTPILAAADGQVSQTGFDVVYGNFVVIDHAGGYQTVYGHMKVFFVKRGQIVHAGEVIGKIGTTGQSTGPHVHFEIHLNGVAKDPMAFIRRQSS